MLAITNNFQTSFAAKKPAMNQQKTTFTAQPTVDTFTKSTPKQEVSFNGKIWDAVSGIITGRTRNSKELMEYVTLAKEGEDLYRLMTTAALCDTRELTDESQIAAIEMLEEHGSQTDMEKLFEHVVCSDDRSERVTIKAIYAIPKMAERLNVDKATLENIHEDLEPIFYLPENIEFAAESAQAQIQSLIDSK